MSNEHTPSGAPVADDVDLLLNDAFERALMPQAMQQARMRGADTEITRQAFVDRVMARIARRQRARIVVLTLVGCAAAIFVAFSALPILGVAEGLFAEFTSSVSLTDWQHHLPELGLALAVSIGIGWLMMEEALLSP